MSVKKDNWARINISISSPSCEMRDQRLPRLVISMSVDGKFASRKSRKIEDYVSME